MPITQEQALKITEEKQRETERKKESLRKLRAEKKAEEIERDIEAAAQMGKYFTVFSWYHFKTESEYHKDLAHKVQAIFEKRGFKVGILFYEKEEKISIEIDWKNPPRTQAPDRTLQKEKYPV